MIRELKQNFLEFNASPPGERFQALHRRRAERGTARKPLMIATGIGLMVMGLAMLVLPGPGLVVLAVGLALIVQESLVLARGLDWLEQKVRK